MKNIAPFRLVALIFFLAFSNILVHSQSSVTTLELAEVSGISADRLERFGQFLNTSIEDGKLPGAVLMVSRKGKIVHHKSYGYSSLADKKAMQDDQIFYIQSMTKPIVSVAFMMLYEEGHFFLTDRVDQYLPQFKEMKVAKDPAAGKDGETEPANKPIRIWHLLSHSAGFSHGLGRSQLDRDYFQALYREPHQNIEDRVNTLAALPLVGHPGEQWYYSASPDVLALLIEHFSGKPVAEFLQDRLFTPLGMEDTGYNLAAEKQPRMVQLHNRDKENLVTNSPQQTPMEGNTVHGGTHGLFSTAADYMKFAQMLLNDGTANGHQFLSPKTIELMTQNHVGELYQAPGQGFGLGFGVMDDLAANRALGSVGQYYWNGAFNTHFFIDPQEELVAIIMTQTQPYSNFMAAKLRQFVYQAIVD